MTRSYLGYVSSQTTDTVPVMAYGVATGGTAISPDPVIGGVTYRVLEFTGDATLTVTQAGLFDVMLVGGGGAGGGHGGLGGASSHKGGGGAGQVSFTTVYLSGDTSITVGGGAALYATNGSTSRVGTFPDSVVAFGGGTGSGMATVSAGEYNSGRVYSGASGGGGNTNYSFTFGIGYAGNNGGTGSTSSDTSNGKGGGGGAGAVGENNSGTAGGNGGAGYDASAWRGESATTTYYGGGGGGGGASGGTGGVGGGGNRGSNGSSNTGGGGGGSSTATSSGGTGGSGIVLVRFKTA